MDFLAGYSSEDESPVEDSSYENRPPSPPAFLLYLENYMARHNLVTAFVQLPFRPSPNAFKQLNRCCDVATKVLLDTIPGFASRYRWHYLTSVKPTAIGTFGYTNKNSIGNLHISLFPNFHTKIEKLKLFLKYLERAVHSVNPDPSLVKVQEPSILDTMLKQTSPKRVVQLTIEPHFKLRFLKVTNTFFLCVDADPHPLLSHDYLYALTRAIEEQAQLQKVRYSWKTFTVGGKNEPTDLQYHCSLVMCEVKLPDYKATPEEYSTVENVLSSLDMSDYLKDITFDLDTLELRSNCGVKSTIPLLRQ